MLWYQWTEGEDDMPAGRHTTSDAGGRTVYTSEESWDWTVVQMRREFSRQSPVSQEETRQRVIRLLLDEVRRGQRQPSALARLARKVYGISI
jgi:hypothetical protein